MKRGVKGSRVGGLVFVLGPKLGKLLLYGGVPCRVVFKSNSLGGEVGSRMQIAIAD